MHCHSAKSVGIGGKYLMCICINDPSLLFYFRIFSHLHVKDLVSLLMKLSDMSHKYMYMLFKRRQFLIALTILHIGKGASVTWILCPTEQKKSWAKAQICNIGQPSIRSYASYSQKRRVGSEEVDNCYFTFICKYIQ